jgi:hypothetical protein
MEKKNISLLIAVTLPILTTLLIAATIYLPRLFIQPKDSFLYISPSDRYKNIQYGIANNKLIQAVAPTRKHTFHSAKQTPKFYIYDSEKDQSEEISFEQAQTLTLNKHQTSPAGFTVTCKNSSHYCNTRYLSGHNMKKPLNLQLNTDDRYNSFRFLGWTKKNED